MLKKITPKYVAEPTYQSKTGTPYKNGQCRVTFTVQGKDGANDVWFSGFCNPDQVPVAGREIELDIDNDPQYGWQFKIPQNTTPPPQSQNLSGGAIKMLSDRLSSIETKLAYIVGKLDSLSQATQTQEMPPSDREIDELVQSTVPQNQQQPEQSVASHNNTIRVEDIPF